MVCRFKAVLDEDPSKLAGLKRSWSGDVSDSASPAKKRPIENCGDLLTVKECLAKDSEFERANSAQELKDLSSRMAMEGPVKAMRDLLAAEKEAQKALQKAAHGRLSQMAKAKAASQSQAATAARQAKKKGDGDSKHALFNHKYVAKHCACTYTEEQYKKKCEDGSVNGAEPFVVSLPWLAASAAADAKFAGHLSWWKPRFRSSPQYANSGRGRGACPDFLLKEPRQQEINRQERHTHTQTL